MVTKVNLRRRQLLIGSVAAGIAGTTAATVHDGELGAPPQTIRGVVPWRSVSKVVLAVVNVTKAAGLMARPPGYCEPFR